MEAGKQERALDLVDRLHLEKSYDVAMAIADRHRKLVDRIESRKDAKFVQFPLDDDGDDDEEEDEVLDEESPEITELSGGGRPRISPDSAMAGRSKRPFDDHAESRHVRQKQAFAR